MHTRFAGALRAPLFTLALICATQAQAQAFVNLDFEQGVFDSRFSTADWESALPGWSHSSGYFTNRVFLNYPSSDFASSQQYQLRRGGPYLAPADFPTEGKYGVSFRSGFRSIIDEDHSWAQAFIAQTGTLASDAKSLHLIGTGEMQVTLDGRVLPLINMGGYLLAADVSAFAGRNVELRFTDIGRPSTGVHLDSIRFSAAPVPEPTAGILGAAGIAIVGLMAWRRVRTSAQV